ncbi:MAG TPA: homocysteine S-methyltransferase family protein [bacterium]|nr:homocysteine S-methyltransferase family protein [bacterium]
MSKSEIILTDGAMGTMLLPHIAPGTCLEGLNIGRPGLVEEIHRSYVDAGAEALLANTFGGNRPRLARHRLQRRLEAVNRAGLHIAKSAAGKRPVYASVGPLGPAAKKMAFSEMRNLFREQALALKKEKPHGYVVETMTSLTEAEAAVAAIRGVSDGRIVVLMTKIPRSAPLSAEAAEIISVTLKSAGADVLGANCGAVPEDSYEIIKALSAAGDGPFAVRIAGGLPGRVLSPEDFAEWGPRFAKLGCRWIGGCCGTTPAHIRALGDRL